MSDKLTNQEAGRLAREIQGHCLTASRTQSPGDRQSVTTLIDLVLRPARWSQVDPDAFQLMFHAQSQVSEGCFTLAAEDAGRAARILEAKSANRGA